MADSQGRNQLIDAFRGIAIIAVLAFHYTVRWPEIYGFDRTYPEWLSLGAYGVHLFFVVSGLVITMTVLRSRSAFHFAVRRFARLYPALLIAAVVTFILTQWGPEQFQRTLGSLFASLTMDARLFGQRYVDGAYWSLAVEAKFYCLIALSWALLRDRFWIAVLAIAAASALPLGNPWAYMLIAAWWPYLLAGMAGWYGIFERKRMPALCLAAMAVVLYLIQRPADWLVDVVLVATICAFLVLLWCARNWQPIAIRALAWIGALSYSLYLIHQNVGVTLIRILTEAGLPDLAAIAGASAAMIGVAYLGFHYVEKPGSRWVMGCYEGWRSRRIEPSPERPARQAAD